MKAMIFLKEEFWSILFQSVELLPGVMTADLLESVCIDVEHDTDSGSRYLAGMSGWKPR